MKKYKLAILTAHPIQYQAPLFRKLANHPEIDLMVYFCCDFGVREPAYDKGFGKKIKWDVPLLDGYKYKFLPNWFQINLSIITELFRNRYDAVWIYGYASFTNWLAFFGAWISRTPILLRGESHLLTPRPTWRKMIKKYLLKWLFRNISGFLAIGTLNKEYYKHYKVPDEKIFNIPYMVDEDFFKEQSRKWEGRDKMTRKELGLSENSIIILYVGKIFGAKGPGTLDLLKAYHQLTTNSVALVFVGDGKERIFLEEYAEKQNVKNVIFTGFKNQTEIPKYYGAADIFVLPSYSEQWGVVINEAMYFSNAIIASDQVGAAYDLVQPGKNGYIFPVGNIEVLAEALKKLISNRILLKTMQNNSLKIIKQWSLDECVNGVLSAFNYIKLWRNQKQF
jgi:glycosyltransferase involved in cell wall biosynthesis